VNELGFSYMLITHRYFIPVQTRRATQVRTWWHG